MTINRFGKFIINGQDWTINEGTPEQEGLLTKKDAKTLEELGSKVSDWVKDGIPASEVVYDNTGSVFKGDNVKQVLDEVSGSIDKTTKDIEALDGALKLLEAMFGSITQSEYDSYAEYSERLYFIKDKGRLMKVYYGRTLLAKRSDKKTNLSFPYDIPMLF